MSWMLRCSPRRRFSVLLEKTSRRISVMRSKRWFALGLAGVLGAAAPSQAQTPVITSGEPVAINVQSQPSPVPGSPRGTPSNLLVQVPTEGFEGRITEQAPAAEGAPAGE